jgi:hypothetical protein
MKIGLHDLCPRFSFLYLLEPEPVQQPVSQYHSETKCRDEGDEEENEELPQSGRVDEYDNGGKHQNDADNGYEPFYESTGLILRFHFLSFPKILINWFPPGI